MSRWEVIQPVKPTLRERVRQALRSITLGPWNPRDKTIARYFSDGRGVSSGVRVTEDTALTFSAFRSGVSRIANDISSLPLMFYRRLEDGGKQRWDTHALYALLHDQPNPEQTSMVFRRTLQGHVIVWGNAFAEIERDTGNRPRALWPIHPARVCVERDSLGRLRYRVKNYSQDDVLYDPSNMLHLRGFGTDDGTVGDSLITHAKESLGLGIAAERYGAGFFGNGSTMAGLISWPQGAVMSDAARKDYLKVIENRHQGVDNAHKILALFDGADFKPFGIPPNAAQFLETRTFQVRDVARWLHIPPHLLADLADATFANVEQMRTEYYQSCLRPWQQLWEEELTVKLISPLERRQQMIEHVTQGFLAGDSAGRAAYYRDMKVVGAMTINEMRARENLNPIPGGDTISVDLQSIPIDLQPDYWKASIAKMEADAVAAKRPPVVSPDGSEAEDEVKALQVQLELARIEIQRAEDLQEKAEQERDEARRCQAEAEAAIAEVTAQRDSQIQRAETAEGQLATETARQAATYDELVAVEADRDAVRAELLQTQSTRDGLAQSNDAQARALAAKTAAYDAIEKQLDEVIAIGQKAISENDRLTDQLDAEKEANARHALTITERDETIEAQRQQLVERTARIQGLETEATGLEEDVATARAELAALQESATAVTATCADLHATILAVRDELAQMTEREQTLLTEKQLFSDDIDTLQQQLAGAEACIEVERALDAKRRTALLAAQRAIMADVMGRMVRREVSKAKSYVERPSTTPSPTRLRVWMSNFYDQTEEALFTEALLPAVRLHLSWLGSSDDPAEVARAMVREHFAESQQKLTLIADAGVEGFAEALQRTLQRWESSRAEQFADRVLQQEIDHVR